MASSYLPRARGLEPDGASATVGAGMLIPLLVLFIGQSNMDGYGNTGPAPYTPRAKYPSR